MYENLFLTFFCFLICFRLKGKEAEALCRLKLNYEEITPCSEDEVRPIWTAMLNHTNRQSTRFDRVQIEDAVKAGQIF